MARLTHNIPEGPIPHSVLLEDQLRREEEARAFQAPHDPGNGNGLFEG